MPNQFWVSLLDTPATGAWQTTNGTALSTATTATISPQINSQDFTLPANYIQPGTSLRIWAQGFVTTTTTSTTLTVLLAANKAGTYTTIATSAGIATGTTVVTGAPWALRGFITGISAPASSGNTVSVEAIMELATNVAPAFGTANCTLIGLPSASGATSTAIDTTAAQGIALRATLAGANATIQCTNWDIEALD